MDQTVLIKVIDHDGKTHEIEAPTDFNLNVMEIVRAADLPMEGTCGGMALCASCHVYIESAHEIFDRSEEEEDMLDQAFFVMDNSRLACQIPVEESLDGLVIRLAPQNE